MDWGALLVIPAAWIAGFAIGYTHAYYKRKWRNGRRKSLKNSGS